MLKNIDIKTLLNCAWRNSNSVIDCLPNHLQEIMKEARDNIRDIIVELGFNNDVIFIEGFYHGYLDKFNLYLVLNSISRDLSISTLLIPCNVKIEDALYNVSFVMKKMDLTDNILDNCYDNYKKKILK